MLNLLIAILIALGCNVKEGSTADEIRAENPEAYERALVIQETGGYKTTDGGGIVIIEIGGD